MNWGVGVGMVIVLFMVARFLKSAPKREQDQRTIESAKVSVANERLAEFKQQQKNKER